MNESRRSVLATLAAAMLVSATGGTQAVTPKRTFAAALFDGFALFDMRPAFVEASQGLPPDLGRSFVETWRSRQFEYQWLRALTGHYADFEQATEDALMYAGRQTNVPLSEATRKRIMSKFHEASAWPDVADGLATLKRSIPRLGLLSNMTDSMLRSAVRRSRLTEVIDPILSTDASRTYKPDPRAYALGTRALHLPREEILFVAFAGWDAAGARLFGYPTFWLNRTSAPTEELGAVADATGVDMASLIAFATRRE